MLDDRDGRPQLSIKLPAALKQGPSGPDGTSYFEFKLQEGYTLASVTIVEMAGDEGPWTIENFKDRDRQAPADPTKLALERTPDGLFTVDSSQACACEERKLSAQPIRRITPRPTVRSC